MTTPESHIRATLTEYHDNLVASNAEGCAALYTEDGSTMAQHFETRTGREAIRAWYELCFSLIALDVEFRVQEVVVVSDEYAFARTTSAGTQRKVQGGEMSRERNQELFVMRQVGGKWRIARYCFCTMNAPAK